MNQVNIVICPSIVELSDEEASKSAGGGLYDADVFFGGGGGGWGGWGG